LDLFLRCREAGQRLECWTWVQTLQRWSGLLVGLLTAVLAVGLLASANRFWWPVLEWLSDLWRVIWLVVKRAGEGQWWFAAGIGVVIVVVLYLFSRSARA
jgi:hypothetical protein